MVTKSKERGDRHPVESVGRSMGKPVEWDGPNEESLGFRMKSNGNPGVEVMSSLSKAVRPHSKEWGLLFVWVYWPR